MNLEQDDSSQLLRRPTLRNNQASALSGAHTSEGRASALEARQEMVERYNAELDRARFVDPIRSNSCDSLVEANHAVTKIMEGVDHILMKKKIDKLRMPAGKITTIETGRMVAC